jgi:predicted HTH transcriptional regulator
MKLEELLTRSEGKTLEFKQDLSSPKNILKTLTAKMRYLSLNLFYDREQIPDINPESPIFRVASGFRKSNNRTPDNWSIMHKGAKSLGYPEPSFSISSFFSAVFNPIPAVEEVAPQTPRKYPASTPQVLVILNAAALGEKTREELQAAAEIKDREHFRKQYLEALLSTDLLERTIPDKPRSPKQRYRTTAAGRAVLENAEKERQP